MIDNLRCNKNLSWKKQENLKLELKSQNSCMLQLPASEFHQWMLELSSEKVLCRCRCALYQMNAPTMLMSYLASDLSEVRSSVLRLWMLILQATVLAFLTLSVHWMWMGMNLVSSWNDEGKWSSGFLTPIIKALDSSLNLAGGSSGS